MIVKVFQSNANGKIEFTRAELEKLLNEVYKKGYDIGVYDTKQNYWTWTSPSVSIRTPSTTYATNTSTSIDNLRCDNVHLKDVGEKSINVNLAKSIDDIVNALFNSNPNSSKNLAPNGCVEASTPHAKLAKELRGL